MQNTINYIAKQNELNGMRTAQLPLWKRYTDAIQETIKAYDKYGYDSEEYRTAGKIEAEIYNLIQAIDKLIADRV